MDRYSMCAFADEAADGIEQQVQALRGVGADLLELRSVDGVNVADLDLVKARELAQYLEFSGISVWALGSPLGKSYISLPHEYESERLERLLELARIFGTKRIRMFSYYVPAGEQDGYFDEVVQRLAKLTETAEQNGVMLCHENEKGIFGDTPERCAALLDAVPKLKCVFDPANFAQCGCDVRQAYDLLGSRVDYMHIKDCREDGMIVLPGRGVCAIEEIAARYLSAGGRVFTLEPHMSEFTSLAGLEKDGKTITGGYNDRMSAFKAAGDAFASVLEGCR